MPISGVEPDVTFLIFLNGVEFVAGIDTLGRIACVEIRVEFQPADFFHYGDAFVLCYTGIYCRFVDNNIAGLDYFSYCCRRTIERCEIGIVVFIYRSRDGYYEEIAILDFFNIGSTYKAMVLIAS